MMVFLSFYLCFKQGLSQSFNSWFLLSTDTHINNKRWSFLACVKVLCQRNKFHEKKPESPSKPLQK